MMWESRPWGRTLGDSSGSGSRRPGDQALTAEWERPTRDRLVITGEELDSDGERLEVGPLTEPDRLVIDYDDVEPDDPGEPFALDLVLHARDQRTAFSVWGSTATTVADLLAGLVEAQLADRSVGLWRATQRLEPSTPLVSSGLSSGDLVCAEGPIRDWVGARSSAQGDVAIADAHIAPGDEPGRRSFNRPPRLPRPPLASELVEPVQPSPPRRLRFPLVATIAPIVVAAVLVAVFRNPIYAVFALMSPVMVVGNWFSDRRGAMKEYRAALAAFEQRREQFSSDLSARLALERTQRLEDQPDPLVVGDIARLPSRRLWERRPGDEDFLRLRLGLADQPSTLTLRREQRVEATIPMVERVPVTMALPEIGVLGIAGPQPLVADVLRSVVLQLGALHSPAELGLVVLAEPSRVETWEWAKWLPHLRHPALVDSGELAVAFDEGRLEEQVRQLRRLVERRLAGIAPTSPAVVVVIDGAEWLRSVGHLDDLLVYGATAGVWLICADRSEVALPGECRAVVAAESWETAGWTLRRPDGSTVGAVPFEAVASDMAEAAARSLASLRPGRGDGAGALPSSVGFLEHLDLGRPEGPGVAQRWAVDTAPAPIASLGPSLDGPLDLDLRNGRDGPHGLVCGKTGSGKSDFLRTFVTSLALSSPPSAMAFLLFDLKEGSGLDVLAELPHTLGVVTNLDPGEVQRALDTLDVERSRRQATLKRAGHDNLESYQQSEAGRAEPIPRLVVVVDEFPVLNEDFPDGINRLVRLARLGRSAGIHLVLGTQTITGNVSKNILDNTTFHVCLRVEDQSESREVIGVPDAAFIPEGSQGRGLVEVGGAVRSFQTAWLGARRVRGGPVRSATVVPFSIARRHRPPGSARNSSTHSATDFERVVSALRDASRRIGHDVATGLWLPPLPERVTLEELPPGLDEGPVSAAVGLQDLVAEQDQRALVLDFERMGNLLIVGAARSGRTTALRTIAGALARNRPPRDLHLYALDFAGHALRSLEALPHCGAAVTRGDRDRLERLLELLTEEIATRQERLASAGSGSLAEHRSRFAESIPYAIVLLDGYETFHDTYLEVEAGRFLQEVDQILRDGPAVGVFTVLATDGTGITSHDLGSVAARLILRQADRATYAVYDLDPRAVPSHMPPGRALWMPGGHETQVALLGPDPAGAAQNSALGALAAELDSVPPDERPRPVVPMPSEVRLSDIGPILHERRSSGGDLTVTLGVGGAELRPISVDLLGCGPTFLIAGPRSSGRTTALATVLESLRPVGDERRTVVLAPRPSLLRRLAEDDAVRRPERIEVHPTVEAFAAESDRLLASSGLNLLVDDAERFLEGPAASILERFLRDATDRSNVLVAAGTTHTLSTAYAPWVKEARNNRNGVLLTPQGREDGYVLGLTLPRAGLGPQPPGRGLLALGALPTPVRLQIALPSD